MLLFLFRTVASSFNCRMIVTISRNALSFRFLQVLRFLTTKNSFPDLLDFVSGSFCRICACWIVKAVFEKQWDCIFRRAVKTGFLFGEVVKVLENKDEFFASLNSLIISLIASYRLLDGRMRHEISETYLEIAAYIPISKIIPQKTSRKWYTIRIRNPTSKAVMQVN